MPKRIRTPDKELQISADYVLKNPDGDFVYSLLGICKKHKISKDTLYKIREKYNLPNRTLRVDKKTEKNIVSDYTEIDRFGLFVYFRDEICRKYNISNTTLDAILKRNNVRIRRTRDINKEFRQKVVSDYIAEENGVWTYTISDISLKYQVNAGFIYYILKKEGLTVRRNSQN